MIKAILFYFYERAWSTITWGKELPGAAEAAGGRSRRGGARPSGGTTGRASLAAARCTLRGYTHVIIAQLRVNN